MSGNTAKGGPASARARKSGKGEMNKQHAMLLKGIRVWLEQHPHTTPLELGVFDEIVGRVTTQAESGAFVRVRIKNLGARTAPIREGRLAPARNGAVAPIGQDRDSLARRVAAATPGERREWISAPWTHEELDVIERMSADNATDRAIADALGNRSENSVRQARIRLGITKRRTNRGATKRLADPTIMAARRIRERREREARGARYDEWAAD